MYSYEVSGGRRLDSELRLPELVAARRAVTADFTFRISPTPLPISDWQRTFRIPRLDGGPFLVVQQSGRTFQLSFHRGGEFVLEADSGRITGAALEGRSPALIRYLLLDHVLPRAISVAGSPVLHASAVVVDGAAVAFVGQSGVGKSTLAASFACRGHRALTDDWLELQGGASGWSAIPAYGSHRLWSDSVASLGLDSAKIAPTHVPEKWRVTAVPWVLPHNREPATLRHLYFLAPTDPGSATPAEIIPIEPRTAMIELVKHSYRLDIADPVRLATEFRDLASIAHQVPASVLRYSRRFSTLPAIRTVITAHMSQTPPPALPPVA
jgi:hypothetical protein